MVPGVYFFAAGLAYLAHDRFSEARRRRAEANLRLVVGKIEVTLHVEDGSAAAVKIVDELAPYTRAAPITRPDVYEDARRRLRAQAQGKTQAARRDIVGRLTVGDELVRVDEGHLFVGNKGFRIEDVREYALRWGNLPLGGGRFLQAALGLLIIEAERRAQRGEDLEALGKRIQAYEEWTGRTAGR
jgi:hypothetical protein